MVGSKQIAERLKEARKKNGHKSAKAFAESTGIPLATYRHHENGTRKVNTDYILKYSKLLNLHPAWLMTGEDYVEGTHKEKLSDLEFVKVSVSNKLISEQILKKHAPGIVEDFKSSEIDVFLFTTIANKVLKKLYKSENQKEVNKIIADCINIYNKTIQSNQCISDLNSAIELFVDLIGDVKRSQAA